MGMYNEVFKKCPKCSGQGYMQIRQITLGFGEFDLDNPESLIEKLTEKELEELEEALNDQDNRFDCKECGYPFHHNEEQIKAGKEAIIKRICK